MIFNYQHLLDHEDLEAARALFESLLTDDIEKSGGAAEDWVLLAGQLVPSRARRLPSGEVFVQCLEEDSRWTSDVSRAIGWAHRQDLASRDIGHAPTWTPAFKSVAVAKAFDDAKLPMTLQRYGEGANWSGWLVFNGDVPPGPEDCRSFTAYGFALKFPWAVDFLAMPVGISVRLVREGGFEYSLDVRKG